MCAGKRDRDTEEERHYLQCDRHTHTHIHTISVCSGRINQHVKVHKQRKSSDVDLKRRRTDEGMTEARHTLIDLLIN